MKIIIPLHIMATLRPLVENCEREFTLFGKTEIVDGNARLIDFRIPEQTSCTGETEVEEDELVSFIDQLITDGEDTKDWNMWIHSHHTMGAFWSATDKEQMAAFSKSADLWFHVVLSTTGMQGACTMHKPFGLTDYEVEIEIEDGFKGETGETKKLQEVFKKVVKTQKEINKLEDKLDKAKEKLAELKIEQKEPSEYVKALMKELDDKNKKPVYVPKHQYKSEEKKRVPVETGNLLDFKHAYTSENPPITMDEMEKVYEEQIELSEAVDSHHHRCMCDKCDRLAEIEKIVEWWWTQEDLAYDSGMYG